MKFLRVITLLSLLFLQNCDFGCVGSEEFGVLTLKNIEVHANPFGSKGLRGSVTAVCRPDCETAAADGTCSTFNYWTSLEENYDSNYDYQVRAIGQVSFCSVVNMVTGTLPDFELSSAIRDTTLDGTGHMLQYPANQYVTSWNDISASSPRHATQNNIIPPITCAGQNITIYDAYPSGGNAMTMAVGNYGDLGSLNENVKRAVVPVGCKLQLYDNESFTGSDIIISPRCTADSQMHTPIATYLAPALTRNSCWTYSHSDRITSIDVASGCKIVLRGPECWGYGAITDTLHFGDGSTVSNVIDYQILQEDDPVAIGKVPLSYIDSSSASVTNDPVSSSFSSITDMTPTMRNNVFGIYSGLEFDGTNDFLYFDNVASFVKSPHTLFFIVKDVTRGTLFSSNKLNFDINERLYIEAGSLKYQKGGVVYILSSAALPSAALITIIRSGGNLIARVNGEEVFNGAIGAIDTGVDVTRVSIGQYWDGSSYPMDFVPTDFLSGYIGTIRGYSRTLSGSVLRDIEKELMVYWAVLNCGFGKHLDRVRLRIGADEYPEVVFNPISSNFEIPTSYNASSGNMMVRLADPIVEGNGCAPTAADITANSESYNDNLGSLELNFRIMKDSSMVGNLYEFFIQPIERYITGEGTGSKGIEQVFFEGVTGAGGLIQKLVTIALTFFVIFTAISYLMGFVRYSNWDLISRMIKVGLVLTFVSDGSWSFFSTYVIGFFRDGALDLFGDISLLVNSETGVLAGSEASSVSNLFANLDNIFAMFISAQVNAKIWGLLFFPVYLGFLMIIMFYYAFYIYVHIIAKVLILYTAIFIMMTFAFIIAPVFIIFVLFQRTREYFTKWLDLVIGYGVQLIFLAAIVGIFSWIIMAVFIDLLNYTVCWKPVLYCCGKDSSIHFTLLEFFRPASFDYRRFGSDIKMHYAPGFWDVALFLFIVYLFREFLTFSMNLATTIAGGVSTGSLADSIGKTLGTESMASTVSNVASGGAKYGLRAAGAVGMAGGTAVAGLAGLAAGGGAAIAKMTGSQRAANFSKSAANFSAKAVNKSYSHGMKAMNDTYYREAKGAVYNQTIGRANRAVFGIRGPDEQGLVDDIKAAVRDANITAATNGTAKDVEIKKAVRNMLEKKGFSEKKINKVLNSKQLGKDMKYSKLQTKDAKTILTNSYINAYREAEKNVRENPALASGKDPHRYAQQEARKAMTEAKGNIGKLLRAEHAVQEGEMGRVAKFGNRLTMNNVESRLNNMAAMSRRLEKELGDFGKDDKVNSLESAAKYLGSSIKDPLDSTYRTVDQFAEKFGFASKETNDRTTAEEREYNLYDDKPKAADKPAKKDSGVVITPKADSGSGDVGDDAVAPDFSDGVPRDTSLHSDISGTGLPGTDLSEADSFGKGSSGDASKEEAALAEARRKKGKRDE